MWMLTDLQRLLFRRDLTKHGAGRDGFVDVGGDADESATGWAGDVEGDFADEKFDEAITFHDLVAGTDKPATDVDRFVGGKAERGNDERNHSLAPACFD